MIGTSRIVEDQEYRILRESAASYAAKELAPRAELFDYNPSDPSLREAMSRAGDLGMLAALIPEEYGGGGLDGYAFCVVLEEIAVADAGVAAAMLSHNAALYPAALGEQKGSIAGAEPDAFPACLAYPGDIQLSGGRIKGRVPFAFNAYEGRLITMFPSSGAGTQAFVVCGDSEEVDITPDTYPLGLRAARPGSIHLNGAEPSDIISGGNMLEEVEKMLFMGLSSIAIGIIRNSFKKAYEYARERYQAGKLIIEHQQMRLFLAEMLTAVEQGRAALKRACESEDMAPAMSTWLLATEKACKSAIDGVQIHGGYGYMRDYGMERLMRDAKYCQMYPSTSQETLLRLMEMSEKG
jgi:alkylation response protein AidB-like acyl-CoA dehydrogenase